MARDVSHPKSSGIGLHAASVLLFDSNGMCDHDVTVSFDVRIVYRCCSQGVMTFFTSRGHKFTSWLRYINNSVFLVKSSCRCGYITCIGGVGLLHMRNLARVALSSLYVSLI